jgi:hypothetical protein
MHMIVSRELTLVIPPKAAPEVLAASGIKPPVLADRRKGGTGEPELVECACVGKIVCSYARTYERHRGKIIKRSTRKI